LLINKDYKFNIMDKISVATIGTITKKEMLQSVDLEKCKTLVLETSNAFPGYHGYNLPEKNIPGSLFLITKVHHSDEDIVRAIGSIKRDEYPEFDATPCTVNYRNQDVYGIRFKNLKYDDIKTVVKLFNEHDIYFKERKLVAPYQSVIRIRKFFEMDRVDDGIYIDSNSENHYYVEIPKVLTWDEFEKLTYGIKQNIDDSNFDAALVYIFSKYGIIDMVRIYYADNNLDKLKVIKRKYLENIK